MVYIQALVPNCVCSWLRLSSLKNEWPRLRRPLGEEWRS